MIIVYTDGASGSKRDMPIGSAAVILYTSKTKTKMVRVLLWSRRKGTNNIAEMMAAIIALEYYQKPKTIKIISDSKILVQGATEWLPKWKRNHWKAADGSLVKNQVLWKRLDKAVGFHKQVIWEHVKGHHGNYWNEKADAACVLAKNNQIIGEITPEPVEDDIRI